MQKERGSSRSLSLHQEIEREVREIEMEMERHPELDNLHVTEEVDAALLKKIQAYEEEMEEEREAVKRVEENLRKNHYLSAAGEAGARSGKDADAGKTAGHFRVPGDSVEFAAELMPEIPKGFAAQSRRTDSVGTETGGEATVYEGLPGAAADSAGEEKLFFRKRRRGKYALVSLAAVLVIVMGFSVTSVGSKSHWKVFLDRILGVEPEKIINMDDMDVYETDDGEELAVYREIEEKMHIHPVRITYKPIGMIFDNYEVHENILKAEILYKYKGEIIRYFLYMNDEDSSWAEKEEDKKIDEYTVSDQETEIKVEEFEVLDSSDNRQVAQFEYKEVHYLIMGTIDRAEFEKILRNLHFF